MWKRLLLLAAFGPLASCVESGPTLSARSKPLLAARTLAQSKALLAARPSPRTQPAPAAGNPAAALQATAGLFILGLALVALTPTSHIIDSLGAERGMQLLTVLATTSAAAEIGLSPLIGGLADSIGRKPVLLGAVLSAALANGAVALAPFTSVVATAKFISSLVVGLFFLSGGEPDSIHSMHSYTAVLITDHVTVSPSSSCTCCSYTYIIDSYTPGGTHPGPHARRGDLLAAGAYIVYMYYIYSSIPGRSDLGPHAGIDV